MDKGLKIVLEEMCKRVGADFDSINFKKEGWYNEYSWTIEEEADFKRWLVDKMMRDKEIREGLLENPRGLTKKKAEKAAQEFVFRFGWRYEKTDEFDKEYK